MSKKTKAILITTLILVLSLGLYNLLFFLIPVNKSIASLWPSFIVTNLMMLQVWVAMLLTFNDEGLNENVFKNEYVRKSMTIEFMQIVLDVFIMILCAFYNLPFIIALFMELALVGAFIGTFFIKRTENNN